MRDAGLEVEGAGDRDAGRVDAADLGRERARRTRRAARRSPPAARRACVSTTRFAHLAVALAVVLEHDALDRRAAEVEAEVAAHRGRPAAVDGEHGAGHERRGREVEHRAGDVLGRAEVAGQRLQLGEARADALVALRALAHRRRDQPGRDDVAADALAARSATAIARERPTMPGLARGVGVRREVLVAADEAEHRRDVDDRAAAGRAQPRDRVLAAEEDALQVRVEHRVPRLLGALLDRAVAEAAAADPRRVHEHVEALEAGERPRDLVGPREVGLLAVEADDLRARVGERARDRAADPAGRAGDDRDLARQLAHRRDSYSSAVGPVERIRQERVVAVLRESRVDVDELGTPVVEVTLHVEDAFGAIRALRRRGELTVLAGTVRTGRRGARRDRGRRGGDRRPGDDRRGRRGVPRARRAVDPGRAHADRDRGGVARGRRDGEALPRPARRPAVRPRRARRARATCR